MKPNIKMKATYTKVQGGRIFVSGEKEPEEPNYGDCEMDASDLHITGQELFHLRMEEWTKAMQAFNDSFIETENTLIVQCVLLRTAFNIEGEFKDGLYPVDGLQFEVQYVTVSGADFEFKIPVAIVSLIEAKEESYRIERPVEGGV